MKDNNKQKINYSLMLKKTLDGLGEKRPSLLLHACCAPCSSYVLEYLASRFKITLFFFNPNISPEEEYIARQNELIRLVHQMSLSDDVAIIQGEYHPEDFLKMSEGLEELPEGDVRCKKCYRMRLRESAKVAAERGFDYFTTTLSISPYKNAEWLNTIGKEEGEAVGVAYLFSDFKKNNGYKRSCELSAEYGLYRQNYCGCIFSRLAAEKRSLGL